MNQDEYRKHMASGVILIAACEWHTSQNPMAVWSAIEAATEHGLEIPDWAKDYLLEVSTRLLDGGKPDAALGLKVKGGNSKLKQWKDIKLRSIACGSVIAEAKSGKHRNWTEVFECVGQEVNKSPETVEKWWRTSMPDWDENPDLP